MATVTSPTDIASAACPVCGNSEGDCFFVVDAVPAVCNRLYDSREEARRAADARIELTSCPECGHVFNRAFAEDLVTYDRGYENALHFSERFRTYADSMAADLVDRHRLSGKVVLELGCGDGYFLKRICEIGSNQGIGFDPSLRRPERDGFVTLHNEAYSAKLVGREVDFLICRQVLEHERSPGRLLAEASLSMSHEAICLFEVPNGEWLLDEISGWDLIHEHVSYFTSPSLQRLFDQSGFSIGRTQATFGDQYLCIEARRGNRASSGIGPVTNETPSNRREFGRAFQMEIGAWRERLEEWSKRGESAALWGAGSKGVMFLNMIGSAGGDLLVVDQNPRKQGKFIPCTGHAVVPPEDLGDTATKRIIALNPLYIEEIRRRLGRIGIDATVSSSAT